MAPRKRAAPAKVPRGTRAQAVVTDVEVDGSALRAARKGLGLTIERLAEKAAVTDRTVRRLEKGPVSARRETVELIAAALGVEVEALLAAGSTTEVPKAVVSEATAPAPKVSKRTATATTSATRATPSSPSDRPPTLDELVSDEPPAPPPLADKNAAPQLLTARAFSHVMAAFRGYEGVRFIVRGKLTRQRGLRDPDAAAIESEAGTGVCFLIVVPIQARRPIAVTVHTTDLAATMAMQQRMDLGVTVEGVVWVPQRIAGFAGFRWLATDKPLPWTFVVRGVVGEG